MSSVLSSWFYILILGIASLLLIALVLIFYNPSLFLQLTSKSGQLVDLTGVDNFDPANISSTAALAVIKIGANSYPIANDATPTTFIPNAFVAPGTVGIAAANDVAGAKITGTFMFWLLMLGIGFLSLLLAFIAVKYPAKLFGPQVSALVGCLPKTKSPCSSSSCAIPTSAVFAKPPVITPSQQPMMSNNSISTNSSPAQITAALQQAISPPPIPAPVPVPVPPPPAPAPKVPTLPQFTPAQLAVMQQFMMAMAAGKQPTPQA